MSLFPTETGLCDRLRPPPARLSSSVGQFGMRGIRLFLCVCPLVKLVHCVVHRMDQVFLGYLTSSSFLPRGKKMGLSCQASTINKHGDQK